MSRTSLAIFTAALALVGYWLGEEGAFLLRLPVIAFGIASFAIPLFLRVYGWPQRIIFALAALSIYGSAFYSGTLSFRFAYNECIEEGESVRAALASYASENKHYPRSLNLLAGTLPCQRIVRPNILTYTVNDSGYSLSFQDWLSGFAATESAQFAARK